MSENETPDAKSVALVAIREAVASKQMERAQHVEATRAIDVELRGLRAAEKALDPAAPSTATRETSFDVARRIMEEKGTATMSEVAAAMDKPKNTAKLALARLVEEGVVQRTGVTVARSPQFAWIAPTEVAGSVAA